MKDDVSPIFEPCKLSNLNSRFCLAAAAKALIDSASCVGFMQPSISRTSVFFQVQDVVMVMDESLRPAGCQVAARLRQVGRTVDLILEAKKMKQVFKVSQQT